MGHRISKTSDRTGPDAARAAMASAQVRAALDALIRSRGEDYAGLSRLIGRNPAYIQQYIKRGSPRTLAERDRALLADYLEVDEAVLGAPMRAHNHQSALVVVPRLDAGAAAGAGVIDGGDGIIGQHGFDARWLRELTAQPQRLAVIRVEGDSMVPTLSHGDDIMVDGSDGMDRLRDGIYVLRRDGALLVKRLVRGVGGNRRQVTIVSDNSAYPAESNVPVAALAIVGRVVWAGRRVS